MPFDIVDLQGRNNLAGFRKQLIDSTAGVDVDVAGRTVRLSNVPLFRNVEGRLHQAIRVRIDPGPQLAMTASLDGQILSTLTTTARDVPQSDYLLIPEVSENETISIDIAGSALDFEVTSQRKMSVHLMLHSH